MENQVQRLLQSEKEVNRQVQAALENKRKKLSTIQGEAEIAVKQFKEELEAQMTATVAQVSIAVFKIFNNNQNRQSVCLLHLFRRNEHSCKSKVVPTHQVLR